MEKEMMKEKENEMLELKISIGKASCPICGEKIPKGEWEISVNLGTGLYPLNYHVSCFKHKYWGFLFDIFHTMTEDEAEALLKKI